VTRNFTRFDRGQLKDQPPEAVALTSARNVFLRLGKITPVLKPSPVSSNLHGQNIRAIFGTKSELAVTGAQDSVYMFTGSNSYVTEGDFATTFNSSPTPGLLTSATPPQWQFEHFCGLPVMSNGLNFPYKESNTGVIVPLLGVRSRCQVMGSIGDRLFIANLSATTANGVASPNTPAETGQATVSCSAIRNPESWAKTLEVESDSQEFTDPQSRYIAMETPQQILAYATNRGLLFTDQNVWVIVVTTDDYIFHMDVRFRNVRSISARGACRSDGNGSVYFISDDDIYRIGEKEGIKSIAYGKVRDDIFSRLNRNATANVFSFYVKDKKQVHFCIPTGSSLEADVDFIYSEEIGSWHETDCDFTCFTAYPYSLVATADGRLMRMDGTGGNRQAFIESGDIIGESTRDTIHRIVAFGKNTDGFEYQVGSRQINDPSFAWSRRKLNGEPFNLRGHTFRYRIYAAEGSGDWEISRVAVETSRGGIGAI
jgi:hypothetical protein